MQTFVLYEKNNNNVHTLPLAAVPLRFVPFLLLQIKKGKKKKSHTLVQIPTDEWA